MTLLDPDKVKRIQRPAPKPKEVATDDASKTMDEEKKPIIAPVKADDVATKLDSKEDLRSNRPPTNPQLVARE